MSSSGGTPYALPGQVITGTGSPLGVVTPSGPGVIYQDAAQTNGAVTWVSTGTAATDWAVISGDTGNVNLASALTNGACPGGGSAPPGGSEPVTIRRVNAAVIGYFSVATPSTWTSGTIALVVPAGFRPDTGTVDRYLSPAYASAAPEVVVQGDEVAIYVTGANNAIRQSIAWATNDPWPTGPLP